MPACVHLFKLRFRLCQDASFPHLKTGRSMWLVHRQDRESVFLVLNHCARAKKKGSFSKQGISKGNWQHPVCVLGPPSQDCPQPASGQPTADTLWPRNSSCPFPIGITLRKETECQDQPDLLFCPFQVLLASPFPEPAVPGLLRGWCNPQWVAEGLGCPAPAKPRWQSQGPLGGTCCPRQ